MQCGLLGRKLGHSYSPQIRGYLGDYPYDLYEKTPEELPEFLLHGDFTGLNVTMPYKKDVMAYCSTLSPKAKALNAVNVLIRQPDGSLMGHNTDYYGFETMLRSTGLSVSGKKVLVLGSGGASNTAVAVLKAQDARVVVISRSGENHYGNLDLHADTSVIVNTTPVGMYPNTGESAVNLELFPHLEGVLDVVYNPARTQLLLDAEKRGLITSNGLLMLVAQAKEAAEWFTGTSLPDSLILQIHRKLSAQMQNIVLIGMPGCGKSTVGKLLGEKTGRVFVDADEAIVRLAGKPIPEIFAQEGEEAFRAFETTVLEELGKQSGLVIATGGGCVTKARNYPLLHQNGHIFWLQRNIEDLPTEGRPLSASQDLQKMYDLRKPLYEAFADHTVTNDAIDAAAAQILALLEENS